MIQDKKISIPSRHYLARFKSADESADSFVADLTAGTEYTVEISNGKFYEYPIGNNIPDVEIINPNGEALPFLDFGSYDDDHDASRVIDLSDDVIELSFYPQDNPYVICYTFTPAVTGSYTINLRQINDEAGDGKTKTLFIYEELRSGTDGNEAGYYKRYKFDGADEAISMTDLMELRKAYNSLVYDTLSVVLGLGGDLEDLTDDDWEKVDAGTEAQVAAYFECLNRLKQYYGIFDSKDEEPEVITGGTVNENDEDEDEDDDGEDVTIAAASNVVSVAAPAKLNAGGTQIKQQLFGIPYKDDFQPGVGYFALTGVQARSNAVKSFTLNVPEKKNVKTSYSATFVSSQEDREKISTTTADASFSIGGFGLSAGYSSESKFKFGLTSTTYVIHYEEVEFGYRVLDDGDYQLKKGASKILKEDITKFREKYGDYFVAGYKYGGTYDAFITITTKTMEQLEEVKTKLSANFSSAKVAVSADVGNTTRETLNQNDATVSIQIMTAGIDVSQIPEIPTTTISDITQIPKSLNAFREALKKTPTEGYMPVYVMLKRYSLLDDVDEQMDEQNDSGLIPLSPKHSTKILALNREKLIMDSYYNVIADLTDSQIDSSVRNNFKKEYEDITSEIGTGGNDFYSESNSANMDSLKAKMVSLSERLKAIGDRYVFYQRLMEAQKKEESASRESRIQYRPFGYNGGFVGQDSFAVSRAVASDIAAGKTHHDSRNQFSGKSWEPTFDAGSGYVFCYARVIANNTHDVTRIADLYCVGRQSASFHFTCGVARWLEWDVTLRSMRFNAALYPFSGLK